MFASQNKGHKYVDRGDFNDPDFTVGDFIADETWRDLDLSSIIPKGVSLVLFSLALLVDEAPCTVCFRQKGIEDELNCSTLSTQVDMIPMIRDILVSPDNNGIIQYHAEIDPWLVISLSVRGWWKK